MLLKAALATGKKVALTGVTDGYLSKESIEEMISDGDLSLDSVLSEGWAVEPVQSFKLSETDFKTIWNEVAGEFTSVKTFENSVLAKRLLTRMVTSYRA